jgi:hypothetical protein
MKISPPSARRPDVPPALDAIVMKALERDRDRRYATAGAMARELDDLVVSARVHVDEVVAFVASIERECRAWTRSSPSPVVRRRWNDAIADATTVKDAGQQQRLSGLQRARRVSHHRRMAAFAGVALVAAALATAVGLRISVTTKNVAEAAEPYGVATSPALPRCEAASWEGAPVVVPIAK